MFLVTNYIDIAVLAILIVVVLISLLFRKLLKSIFTLVITILCIPAGALLSNMLIDKVKNVNIQEISKGLIPLNTSLASMGDYLVNSNETLQDLYQESPAFKDMIESWPDVMSKLILTYVLVIILFFLSMIVFNIIWLILKLFFGKLNKVKLMLVTTILNIARVFVVIIFILLPALVIRPVVKEVATADLGKASEVSTTVTEYIDSSISIKVLDKFGIKIVYSSMNYTGKDGKTYNMSEEMVDAVKVIKKGKNIVNLFSGEDSPMSTLGENFDDEAFFELLESLETVFDELDLLLPSLSDKSHVRDLYSDVMKYVFTKLLKEKAESAGIGFLAKADFSSLDWTNFSFSKDIIPTLVQTFVDHYAEEYTFLKGIDFSKMTLSEIKEEYFRLKTSLTKLQEISNKDLSELNPEDIKEAISSLKDSEIAQTLIDNLVTELTGEETNIDLTNIDLEKEGEILGNTIEIAQKAQNGEELSEEELNTLAESLAQSEVAKEIIESSGKKVEVSQESYESIEQSLKDSGNYSEEEIANTMALFDIE